MFATRRLLLSVAIVLAAAISTATAVEQEAALPAVQTVYPDMTPELQRMLAGVLAGLSDGDFVIVGFDGTPNRFWIEGGELHFAPAAIPSADAVGDFRSALVISMRRRIALDPVRAALVRATRDIVSSDAESLTFALSATGDLVTLTKDGTLCVRSARPLDSFANVDTLGAELHETVRTMRTVNSALTDDIVGGAWNGRRYYSDPPYTFKGRSILAGDQGPYQSCPMFSMEFSATLKVPDIEIVEARLTSEAAFVGGDRWVPPLLMDGHEVIPMVTDSTSASGDITQAAVFGEHTIASGKWTGTVPVGQIISVQMIVDPDNRPDFQIIYRGEAFTSLSSQPIGEILQDWPELAAAWGSAQL